MPASKSASLSLWTAAILAICAFFWARSSLGEEPVYDENSVKAAFIYHFSTFVAWPDDAAGADDDFVIAVLGDDAVAAELQKYLPGRSIQGRPMRARKIDSVKDLGSDAVLFIGAAHDARLNETLAAVSDRPILVVTDAPGALQKGSMINFKIVDRRVRFEISLPAAEHAGLELSSRLLSAAMFVDTTSAIMSLPDNAIASNRDRVTSD